MVDLLLVITPGADWAYVIAASLGDRPIALPVVGLVSRYAVHTALVSAGLGLLVAAEPAVLTALTPVGAAYLLWLGRTPWPVAAQTATLGAVHMLNCAVGYLGVGLLARRLLRARPSAAKTVTRAAGAGMLLVAVLLLVERLTVA